MILVQLKNFLMIMDWIMNLYLEELNTNLDGTIYIFTYSKKINIDPVQVDKLQKLESKLIQKCKRI